MACCLGLIEKCGRTGPSGALSLFQYFKDKQTIIDWPSLKILGLCRQLQTSWWNEFFCPFASPESPKEKAPLHLLILDLCF